MNGVVICPAFNEKCQYCIKGMCYMAKQNDGNPIEDCKEWNEEEDA